MLKLLSKAISVVVVSTMPAWAQSAQPPIEAYGNLPTIMGADISPDGSKVALLVAAGGVPSVVIFKPGVGITARYDASALKTNSVFFGDNEHVIIRASEATSTYGLRGRYEYTAAIALSTESGKSHQLLSKADKIWPAQSGLGKIVGVLDTGEVLMPAHVGARADRIDYDLLRVSLKSGRTRDYATGTDDVIDWFVGNDGQPIVRELYDDKTNTYRLEHKKGGEWDAIHSVEAEEIPISVVAIAADDSGVYYVGSQEEDESYSALSKMNWDGSTERALFSREGKDIENVLTDENRHFVGVEYSGMFPSYDIANPAIAASLEAMMTQFPSAAVEIDSWSADGSSVLYHIFDGYRVDYWVLHDTKSGGVQLLGYSRDDVPAEAIGPVLTIEYPARDGLKIPAVLTLPPGKELAAGVNLPMIVLPHGGPRAYDSFGFDWLAQFFANRGYLVLQPNFRGSTGFGSAFEDAGQGEWGKKMQDDVTDGVQAMIDGGFADADRICIVGASYGGYSALAGGAFTPDLYKCVAAIAPVTDLHQMLLDERYNSGRDHWVNAYWNRLMANGEASRETLDAVSPALHADKFSAPVLLIHGTDDTVVNVSQSREMKNALEKAGKPVKFVQQSGGDHWMSNSETRLQTLQSLHEFVIANIGAAGE